MLPEGPRAVPDPAAKAAVVKSEKATHVQGDAAYGKLPLSFEANLPQTDPQVTFLSRGNGYTLFLTSTEEVLALSAPNPLDNGTSQKAVRANDVQATVVRIHLVGSSPTP